MADITTEWAAWDAEQRRAAVYGLPPATLLKMLISSEVALRDVTELPQEVFEGPDAIPEIAAARDFMTSFLPLAYERAGELLTR